MTRSIGGRDVPPDLAQWGLHAFALGARSTPQAVVAMDDNGVLLYRARHGVTLDQLAAQGVTASQSQLALLRAYGLIAIDGDRIGTAFPVVGPEVLGPLRPRVRRFAADLVPRISGEVAAIAAELRRRGHAGHDYTVVFGHAVDGLLWDRLRELGMSPSTELSIDRPYWNGAFWALYPPIRGAAGVNEDAGAEAALVMVWSDATGEALWDLARSEAGRALMDDPTGQTDIPVLAPHDGDALHRHSMGIADTIARVLGSDPQARALLDAIPDATPQESTLIVAHELIWELMEALVAADLLQPPPGLRGQAAESLTEQLLLRLHPRD
ncbi:hypothetical protein K3N28_10445 [Glycomyces sp. TRM65418]|uniref:hypothetical protein n=1 Tax=Glycomyces sp. TRM65418 TaxID=2867006 RepID=UPI001D16ADE0|nr:hypothetical protein [Glycomyces sp. TRM65418]MCC3763493.1 hypothetical protein [Glycomyces sp. TRM65418]